MNERRLWRASAIMGLVVVAVMLGFAAMPGISACGGSDAIIQFEFARNSADIIDQIKTGECAQGQYFGLWWDAMLFIPSYSTFLILALLALRPGQRHLALAGIAAVVIAAVSDQIEGTRLFAILGDLPGQPAYFVVLHWAVRIKFALLAAATLVIAILLVMRAKAHLVAAALITAGSAATWYGLTTRDLGLVSLGGFLGWVPLIVTAQFIAWRRWPGSKIA